MAHFEGLYCSIQKYRNFFRGFEMLGYTCLASQCQVNMSYHWLSTWSGLLPTGIGSEVWYLLDVTCNNYSFLSAIKQKMCQSNSSHSSLELEVSNPINTQNLITIIIQYWLCTLHSNVTMVTYTDYTKKRFCQKKNLLVILTILEFDCKLQYPDHLPTAAFRQPEMACINW